MWPCETEKQSVHVIKISIKIVRNEKEFLTDLDICQNTYDGHGKENDTCAKKKCRVSNK